MQYEEHLKSNLRALFSAYCDATGLRISTVCKALAADARFYAERVEGERTFTVRGYDQLVGRFLMVWPEGTPWPADVPRAELRELPRGATGRFARHVRTKEGERDGQEAQA